MIQICNSLNIIIDFAVIIYQPAAAKDENFVTDRSYIEGLHKSSVSVLKFNSTVKNICIKKNC